MLSHSLKIFISANWPKLADRKNGIGSSFFTACERQSLYGSGRYAHSATVFQGSLATGELERIREA